MELLRYLRDRGPLVTPLKREPSAAGLDRQAEWTRGTVREIGNERLKGIVTETESGIEAEVWEDLEKGERGVVIGGYPVHF